MEVWSSLFCGVLCEQIEVLSEYVGFIFTIKNIFTLEVIKKTIWWYDYGTCMYSCPSIVLIQITLCEWSVIKYLSSSAINALKNIFVLCWIDMSPSLSFVYFLVYQIPHSIHILQYHEVGWKREMGFPGKHNWKLAHSASAALLKLCPHSVLVFFFSNNVKTQISKYNCKLLIINYHAVFSLYIHLVIFNCPLLSIFRMVLALCFLILSCTYKWNKSRWSNTSERIQGFLKTNDSEMSFLVSLYWFHFIEEH